MARQRSIASASVEREITNFSCLLQVMCSQFHASLQRLVRTSQKTDVKEVLQEMVDKMPYLEEAAKHLSIMSGQCKVMCS